MKLIEKKCPNCGANLSFDENDKVTKCDYCKREFEIERDAQDQINLVIGETGKSVLKYFFISHMVIGIISVIIFLVIFGFVIFGIYTGISSTNKSKARENTYLTDVNDIENEDYVFLDTQATIKIRQENSLMVDFKQKGSLKREKIYVISNDNGNYLIPVYKGVYTDNETTYTIFTPVIYENVKFDYWGNITSNLGTGKVECPTVYFNLEHSEYSVGYENINDLYNATIKQYEEDYEISEK
ncbi:MAG: hypothetical protein IKH54_04970 [Bacilli bacterium]|nr:hypothetical protein [Bacilli bacterium]